MGTKANPGKYDCYQHAEPDEPMFVLLGRDPHAPTLVWLWSVLREFSGEKPDKIAEARDCVAQMIDFAVKRGKSVSGMGESVIAGVMALIRSANFGVDKESAKNRPMTVEDVGLYLTKSKFEEKPKYTFHKSSMEPHGIVVFKQGTSDPATAEEIDELLRLLNG